MNATKRKLCAWAAAATLGWITSCANAEVFYVGPTKGGPGDEIELSLVARAGTVLDSLDIVPDYDGVAGLLELISFAETPALTDDGAGLCTGTSCAFFYLPPKSFSQDVVLATLRFRIDPGAPSGPIEFDLGVVAGVDPVRLPPGQGFQVLAVPEASTWLAVLSGLLGAAFARGRKLG